MVARIVGVDSLSCPNGKKGYEHIPTVLEEFRKMLLTLNDDVGSLFIKIAGDRKDINNHALLLCFSIARAYNSIVRLSIGKLVNV